MSRDLSSNLVTATEASESRPLELYIIHLDSATLYFAAHDTNIDFYDLNGDAQTYTAVAISRNDISSNIDIQVDTMTVRLNNVNRAMSSYIANNNFRGRRLVCLKVFSDYLTNPDDYTVIFDGLMDKPVLVETQMQVSVVSRAGTLHLKTPRRMYQVACNWEFGTTECGYDLEATGISGQTASSGNTTTFWDDSRSEANDYFKHGEILWVSAGLNSDAKRKITISSGTKFVMDYALPSGVNNGDTYTMKRGCPKTHLWCSGLSNLDNYGGFSNIPFEIILRNIIFIPFFIFSILGAIC
uniref:Bacteriophage phiJL001 Gp84 C-terminal domain-containing protein n=1 Tax=viral metagenome TaxID=1070528 RepID=A0A6M3JBI8_9ZZZZ